VRLSSIAAPLCVVILLSSTLGAPAAPQPVALAPATCSTAQLSDVVGVYFNVPHARATPMPVPAGASSFLSKLLRLRLQSCRRALGAGRMMACAPGPREQNDPRLLWTHLRFCELLVNAPHARPEGIAWELPSVRGTHPVIFVLGTGADPGVVSKLVSTLTVYLNAGRDEAGYRFAGDAILIPEPTWTPQTYAAACETSPNVAGAVVVDVTASGSGSRDEFVSRRSWNAVEATALYAQCAHGTPAYVWVSDIQQAQSRQSTFTPLMPLAMLLTLGAMYEEFVPARSTSTTSRRLFPAPKPTPPSGYVSETDTTNTSTINSAQLGSVAGGFLSSSIAYTNNAVPLTTTAVDLQSWNTLQALAMRLIGDMNCWQPAPEPIHAPRAQDIVGPARRLPAYNPPPGLGAYAAGRPSAPFCAQPPGHASIQLILPRAPRTPKP
jgi:hypothetical protein